MPSTINSTTTAGVAISGDNSGVLALQTNNGTTAVTIDTSQNVGIGTTSPTQTTTNRTVLSVNGTNTAIVNLNTGGTVKSYFYYDGTNTNLNAAVGDLNLTADNATNVKFNTNGSERMRITSAGNVGIGTSSPASLLDITGNDPTIRLTDNAGSPASTWSMRSTDGNFAIRDVTNSFDRATFNANGCMALTGANLTATGIGITFPATQSASSDANTLDDYEEGTWTPSYSGTGSNPTVTYGARVGRYTKIGNRVYIQLTIDHSAKSGGSGTLSINLPFQVSAVTNNFPSFLVGYSGAVTPASKGGYTDPARSDFFLQAYNLSTGNYDVSALNASGTLMVSAQYQVD